MRKFAVALLVLLSACAPKTAPVPVVTTPKFPQYVQPPIPQAFADSPAAAAYTRAWLFFQSGDLKTAEREFSSVLNAAPMFYAAETSLGYVELARKDPKAALPHFDRALESDNADVPGLLGRADALLALDRQSDALASLEAAVAADPSLADVRRRIEVLKFRAVEENVARARQFARQNRAEDAVQAYAAAIASSPDSAFLYREVAAIERQRGSTDAALADLQKAIELDPSDAKSIAQVGDILDARGDVDGAIKAYTDALALEPDPSVERRLDVVREKLALSQLPEEYRAIDKAPQITRADLAALIGIRLAPLVQNDHRRDAVLITDTRNNWAASWIMSVARAGVMDPFENHTFQPRTSVRRIDLAQAVARLLTRLPPSRAAQLKSWQAARLKFDDLSPNHLAYPAASVAVASGVMPAAPGTDGSSFQPNRFVTGAEAVDAIARLEALAGLSRSKSKNQE